MEIKSAIKWMCHVQFPEPINTVAIKLDSSNMLNAADKRELNVGAILIMRAFMAAAIFET